MRTNKEVEDELYLKLELLGVNVNAVKRLNLSLRQLDDFCRGISTLMDRHAGWFGEINLRGVILDDFPYFL